MITQITGEDRKILSEVAADSMIQFIGHSPDIKRIADRHGETSSRRASSN